MTDIERRTFAVDGLAVETREGKPALITGHAAVFNSLSENLGGFRERIAPGAFTQAIAEDDIRALFNHDPNFILGRNRSGTLRLREDERGLAIEIDAPDTQTIRDLVLAPIKRGDVTGMSFAFGVRLDGQKWQKDDQGVPLRTLTAVRLMDVSPVVYPAYPATEVALRSLAAFTASERPRTPFALLRAREQLASV